MSIERDSTIRFHEAGTLISVTRWIRSHDEGIAEWLKNTRRAYQPDRANVDEKHRAALLLFRDVGTKKPARMGLLDVGGASLEDVTIWSTWMDPNASSRGSGRPEEQTQGNGAKAYMFKLFTGVSRILGVRDRKLNCKGFDGPSQTVERGTPGFIPDAPSARDLPNTSSETELQRALQPYDITFAELPKDLQAAFREREAFTLVEGIGPTDIYKGRIDVQDLIERILRHDQATLAVQQFRLYAAHNGRFLNSGKPLELEPIRPYPGFEEPLAFEIPEQLPDDSGKIQSTTLSGTRPKGRLILYTSAENMPNAHKKLKPRWKVIYRTQHQMVGSKSIGELVPATPGSYFIHATVELSALEPDYVELGRVRPGSGPLTQALDRFVAEKIRELAKQISDRRRQEQDQESLDEVQVENKLLNDFKNQFLPSGEFGAHGGGNRNGAGGGGSDGGGGTPDFGEVPDVVELSRDASETLHIGRGVVLNLGTILRPHIRDAMGRIVPKLELQWLADDRHVVTFEQGGQLQAVGKGTTEIWARVKGTAVESPKVRVEVWNIDHVLLTPRSLEIQVGKKQQIIAEVTNDEGRRNTSVFLNWKHDADDQLIVRIHPTGWVTGNRVGRTSIVAGAGDPSAGGVWARIPAEVTVVPNRDKLERGGGFPQLLVTERDYDPATGGIRPSNPDQPALWQEVTDYQYNIWWLNLGAPDAAFLFNQRAERPDLWRTFHAQKVVEMVVQVHMQEEFTRMGEAERKDIWVSHKAALERYQVQFAEPMWQKLQEYVQSGKGLNEV
jgi:hypothetical protein